MKKDNFLNIYLNLLNEQDENLDDDETLDSASEGESEETDTSIEADNNEEDTIDDEENEARGLDALIEEYSNKEEITKDDIVKLLNIAVCDELLASFNYMISYNLSKTEGKQDFDPEFEKHEDEEKDHADKLIKRLREMNAEVLTIGWADYLSQNSSGADWKQESSTESLTILQNRYNEELGAIKFYAMVLDCIRKMKEAGDWDTSTERLIKSIKQDEEEHELDLRDLLEQYGVETEINTSVADAVDEDESDESEEDESEDDFEGEEENDAEDEGDDEDFE